jgi:hypothetical protein
MVDPKTQAAAAFRSGIQIHEAVGAPLYAALCARCADDPEMVELAGRGQPGAQPMHLFSSVYDLLLRRPDDSLSRYYPTFTESPAPSSEAFPAFKRFCGEHRIEILDRLQNRTVQSTYVERCRVLLPALSVVADEAGEPLNLVEIGTSAGVLLTVDKYAYDLGPAGHLGGDAPLALKGELHGAPKVRIPKIAARIGLDLHPLDARSEDQRRWVLALIFPEFRAQQTRMAKALDVVAATDITLMKGDALDLLPGVLAGLSAPICVFHSTTLMYWSPDSKAALDTFLKEASHARDIWRVGIEPSEKYDAWYAGRSNTPDQAKRVEQASWGDVKITRYHNGNADTRLAAGTAWDGAVVEWFK